MIRSNHLMSLFLILSLIGGSLLQLTVPALSASEREKSGVTKTDGNHDNPKDEEKGLRFRLSQGVDQPEARPTSNLAPAVPLSEDETANVLKRLPPIKTEASDETEFALRERSLPPPNTGKTIPVSFPASENISRPETTATGPLEVVRCAPVGDVPLAPNLSITFSQPMVAVTSRSKRSSSKRK